MREVLKVLVAEALAELHVQHSHAGELVAADDGRVHEAQRGASALGRRAGESHLVPESARGQLARGARESTEVAHQERGATSGAEGASESCGAARLGQRARIHAALCTLQAARREETCACSLGWQFRVTA